MHLEEKYKSCRILLALAVIVIPAIITCLMLYFYFHSTLFNYLPSSNDEIRNYREVLTFSQVGFSGGYYSYEEIPAIARSPIFGAHGPFFEIFYGAIGRVFGWQPYSGPIYNIALVTLALCILIYITRPDKKQLVMMGLVITSFWPMLLFLPTTMQEGLHLAIAIVLAGFIYVLLSKNGQAPAHYKILTLLLILIASLIKPTWSFLLIPYYILISENQSHTIRIQTIIFGVFLILIIFLLYSFWRTPFPFSFRTNLLQESTSSFSKGSLFFIEHAKNSLNNLISLKNGNILQISQRYLFMFLLLLCSFGGFFLLKRVSRKGDLSGILELKRELFFHIFNLGSIFFSVLLFYDVFGDRDYRNCAPFLLISLLTFILWKKRFGVVILIVLSNLFLFPTFSKVYKEYLLPDYVYDLKGIEKFRNSIKDFLVYKANTNPWCNTLLYFAPNRIIHPYLIHIPPGLGISVVYTISRLQLPIKSKYILSNNQDLQPLSDKVNFQLLNSTPVGNLFLNLDSQCQ
jgi:hypothetical protein